jgi:hypothetical protein
MKNNLISVAVGGYFAHNGGIDNYLNGEGKTVEVSIG